jgi:hypothetical protein
MFSVCAELSSVSTEKVILSPTKLMRAMSSYIPDFDLTSQQVELRFFCHLAWCFSSLSASCLVCLFVGFCRMLLKHLFT